MWLIIGIELRYPGFSEAAIFDSLDIETRQKVIDAELFRSENILISAANKCKEKGIRMTAVSLIGDPRNEIMDYVDLSMASSSSSKMIVIGKRGLGVISQMILGSVSEHLLMHAKMPLMIVPLPDN